MTTEPIASAPVPFKILAEQCETAPVTEQRDWLIQALYALNPAPECGTPERIEWVAKSNHFHALIDAGGFLDAALTLIPADWFVGQIVQDHSSGSWWCVIAGSPYVSVFCSSRSPALGITAGCLYRTAGIVRRHMRGDK